MITSRLKYVLAIGLLIDIILIIVNNILIQFRYFDRNSFTFSMNLVVVFSGLCALLFYRSSGLNWFGNLISPEHPINKYMTELFALIPLFISLFFAIYPLLQKFIS